MAGLGVGTREGDYPEKAPAGGITVPAPDVFAIASDIRSANTDGRVTLGDWAQTLADLGLDFGAGAQPGQVMLTFLRSLPAIAAAHRGEPGMAPIELFFALRNAKGLQDQFSDPAITAHDVGLDLADLVVLEAIFGSIANAFVGDEEPPSSASASMRAQAVDPEQPPLTVACDLTRKYLEKNVPMAGPLFAYAAGKVTEAGLGAVFERLAELVTITSRTAAEKAAFGVKLFNLIGIVAKLQALAAVFSSVQAEVTPAAGGIVDRPSEVEPDVFADFELKVGVSDEEWAARQADVGEFMQSVKVCAREFGIPVLTTSLDLTDDIDKWRSHWRIVSGSEHAKFAQGSTFDIPGQLANYVKPTGDHSGRDAVRLQLEPEPVADAAGEPRRAPVKVRSQVKTDKPPALATYLQVAIANLTGGPFGLAVDTLGVAAGVVDILIGWFQNIRTIDATGTQLVRYRRPNAQWSGSVIVTTEQRIRQSGANDLGDDSRGRGRETAGTQTVSVSRTVIVITGVKSEDTASGKVKLIGRSSGWISTDHDSWVLNVSETRNATCQQVYGLDRAGTYRTFEQILANGQEQYAIKPVDIELELAPDGSWSLEKLERGLQTKVTAATFVSVSESEPGCGLPPSTPQRSEGIGAFGFTDYGSGDTIVTQVGFLDRNNPGSDLTVGRGDPVVVDYDLTNPGRFQEGYYKSHRETDVEVNLHRRGGIVLPAS